MEGVTNEKSINAPNKQECLEHLELIYAQAKTAIEENKPILIGMISDDPHDPESWVKHDIGMHSTPSMFRALMKTLAQYYA